MTPEELRASLAQASPPPSLTVPLAALWWAAKGEWDHAHRLVQAESSPEAAWVHAYLHRGEGDLDNARYWYGQAGRPPSSASRDAEWEAIGTQLLTASRTK
jgi:hypothetical protein